MNTVRLVRLVLPIAVPACAGLLGLGPNPAGAADQTSAAQPAVASARPTITPAERKEAKQIFAAQCSWCHGNYGMTADKGPKLAGTQMTEKEVEERIHNGKPGYMPSFKRFLSDQQIALMAKYIKSLKP